MDVPHRLRRETTTPIQSAIRQQMCVETVDTRVVELLKFDRTELRDDVLLDELCIALVSFSRCSAYGDRR